MNRLSILNTQSVVDIREKPKLVIQEEKIESNSSDSESIGLENYDPAFSKIFFKVMF